MWKFLKQQQQRGAQLPTEAGKARPLGEAPAEAVSERGVQDNEHAGEQLPPGSYPASRIQDRNGDITPSAPDPQVDWDAIVQPEPVEGDRPAPLPEGK